MKTAAEFKVNYLERLKEINPQAKIDVLDIVFIQDSDDYNTMCCELDKDYDPNGYMAAWINEGELIDYLLQWYQDSDKHYMSSTYDVQLINSNYLGYIRIVDDMIMLYSHNSRIGYAGLSKILI